MIEKRMGVGAQSQEQDALKGHLSSVGLATLRDGWWASRKKALAEGLSSSRRKQFALPAPGGGRPSRRPQAIT